jgi:hypothetical protein
MRDRLNKERVTEILESFYKHNFIIKPKREPFSEGVISSGVLANGLDSPGLGDSLILTSVLPQVKIYNSPLQVLVETLNLEADSFSSNHGISAAELAQFDWGGGHCTQRLQRSLGLSVSTKPSGKLKFSHRAKVKGQVFVHLRTNTDWKRGIPNSLDEASIETVFLFFESNKHLTPIYYDNDLTLVEMVKKMESCEFFLGIDSGPMHLAAVLELKSIVIINDSSSGLHLPCLKECRVPNSEWLYPQNTHLNRAGENQLVARFNFENLAAAFLGETYPYWSEEYLDIKIKE